MSSMCFHATQKTLLIHTWLILNKWGNKSNYIFYVCVLQWIYINNDAFGPHSVCHGLLGTLACDHYCSVTLIRNFLDLHVWTQTPWGYNPSDSLLPYVNRHHVWMQSFCIRVRSTHQMCWFVVWKLSNLNKRVQKKRSDVYAMTTRDLLNPGKIAS